MKISTQELLEDLSDRIKQGVKQVNNFAELPLEKLQQQPAAGAWSALACLEHLNRYGEFYIPEVRQALERADQAPSPEFRSGWLGNYLAQSMRPKENGKVSKMKTFASKNPVDETLNKDVIKTFLEQQQELLALVTESENTNLSKVRVRTTLPLIRLRLGDTLRFVIYHNQRHLEQAQRAISA